MKVCLLIILLWTIGVCILFLYKNSATEIVYDDRAHLVELINSLTRFEKKIVLGEKSDCAYRGIAIYEEGQLKCFCHPRYDGARCERQMMLERFLNKKSFERRKVFEFGDTWLYGFEPLYLNSTEGKRVYEYLPDEDLQVNYGKCCVVGSSERLQERRFGEEIDQCDAVMRINDPPVGGAYKEMVGGNTTYNSPNAGFLWKLHNKKKWETIFARNKDATVVFHIRAPHWINFLLTAYEHYEQSIYLMDSLASKRAYDYYGYFDEKTYATTGVITMFWAMHLCDSVTAYGFYNGDSKYKYYPSKNPINVHNLNVERTVIALADYYFDNFYSKI